MVSGTPGCRLWLCGLMGAGKSTVGAILSARLGWPYADNDALLLTNTGRPLAQWAAGGALHAAEDMVLAALSLRAPPLIAGVAAGTIERPAAWELVRKTGFAVYLRVEPELLASRVAGTGRPTGPDPLARLRVQHATRDGAYVAAVDLVVDGAHPPGGLAVEIVDALQSAAGTTA